LIASGDLTQRGKRREFREARDWIDSLDLPAIAVPGNHDTPLLNPRHRVMHPFRRYFDFFGDLHRPLERSGFAFFPFNTARGWQKRANWAEGHADLAELDQLIGEACGNGNRGVLICHHPFLSLPGAQLRTATRNGKQASEKLAAACIDLVITGHLHTPHTEVITECHGGYLNVSAGTLSKRLRASPPGFNLLELSASAVSVTSFNHSDSGFLPVPPQSFAWPK
jgi:3',5'-cyclic AMP phosphodiesterase CpdA